VCEPVTLKAPKRPGTIVPSVVTPSAQLIVAM